jgi:hypothetical protein
MQVVLALLPPLTLLCWLVYLWNQPGSTDLRRVWVFTWTGFNVYLVFSLEALSLFRAVTPLALSLAWLLPSLVFIACALRRWRRGSLIWFANFTFTADANHWLLVVVIGISLAVTLLLAWVAPPQNWDSLTYHMSRVAHWAQNRSLAHYPTGIERQNSMSAGAEMQVLVGYVLSGSDRLANLPAWFALLSSAAAVSWAAAGLGARRAGQWMAAGFTATLPVAVMQASSASTDLVAGCWMACTAAAALAYLQSQRPADLVCLALTSGLAVLTKPTSVPFLLPILLWLGIAMIRKSGLRLAISRAALVAFLVFLLNAGYLARNWITYRQLFNPVDFQIHSHQNRTPLGIASTTLKNLGIHAALPGQPWWNLQIFRLIVGLHFKTGLDINDPRTTADGEYQLSSFPLIIDDRVTNPYHAYLALALTLLAVFLRRRVRLEVGLYILVVTVGIVGFSALYKWNAFGARYHTVLFILLSPLVGALLPSLVSPRIGSAAILGLLVGSLPMLFQNTARPIIPHPLGRVQTSILQTTRLELQFSDAGNMRAYQAITEPILRRSCRQVALALSGEDPEYLFWVLLGAPRQDLNVAWIVSGAPSEKYANPQFTPCAVICSGCPPDQETYRDLPRYPAVHVYQLFLAP